jgi:hypothetical protein
MRVRKVSVPYSLIMMVVISLASLRMRLVSHAGALPPCRGKLAMPVLYICGSIVTLGAVLFFCFASVVLCGDYTPSIK